MSYGIDEDGRFNKKDVVDIREDLRTHVQNELPEDVSLQPNSPVQQLIDAFAIEISRQWDAAEDSYFASFYEDAEGEQLDKQLALAGFQRRPLRPAESVVVFSRDTPAPRDIDIPEGTRVQVPATRTRPNIPFETTESFTLFEGESETDEIQVQGLSPWQVAGGLNENQIGEATNVEANEITEIVDGISGISDVTNPVGAGSFGPPEFQTGRNRETDTEFKLRYSTTLNAGGVSTAPAIQSNIFTWDEDILSVRVTENLPETAIEVFVLDRDLDNDMLAQAVFESKAAGIDSLGEDEGIAEYDDGREVTERFSRVDAVDIYVDVEVDGAETYPLDGERRIKNNIIEYIGGRAIDGPRFPGVEIGEEVIYDQVKDRVMRIRGVQRSNVHIGIDSDPTQTDDITIDELEVAMTDADFIEVTEIGS